MPGKTSLEAVNTVGPFVGSFELAEQTGMAYPKICVVESIAAGGGMVPIQIYVPNSRLCPKYVRINLDPTKLSCESLP